MCLIFCHISNEQGTKMEGKSPVFADTFALEVESFVINKQL